MQTKFTNYLADCWSKGTKFFTIEAKDPELKKEIEEKIFQVFQSKVKTYLWMGFTMTTAIFISILITGGDLSVCALLARVCFSMGVTVYSRYLVSRDGQQAVNKILLLHHINFQVIIFEDCLAGPQFTRIMSMGGCVLAQNLIKKCTFYN